MINLRGKEDMRHSPSVNHRLIQWSLILGIRRNTTRNNHFEMSIWSFYDYIKLNMTRGMYYLIKSFALSGRWMAMVINTQGDALGWQCNGLSGRCIPYQCNGLSGRSTRSGTGRCISSSKLMSDEIELEGGWPGDWILESKYITICHTITAKTN